MTEYNPPISTRETYDLIAIANSTTFDWEQDAIDQAKNELLKRGVTIEYQKEILSQWEEIENQLEIAHQVQLEKNAEEGYPIIQMLLIVILTPILIFSKLDLGPSLFRLRRENFKKKFKQRILLLLAGIAVWIIIAILSANESEKRYQEEIDNVDISAWQKHFYGKDNINYRDTITKIKE